MIWLGYPYGNAGSPLWQAKVVTVPCTDGTHRKFAPDLWFDTTKRTVNYGLLEQDALGNMSAFSNDVANSLLWDEGVDGTLGEDQGISIPGAQALGGQTFLQTMVLPSPQPGVPLVNYITNAYCGLVNRLLAARISNGVCTPLVDPNAEPADDVAAQQTLAYAVLACPLAMSGGALVMEPWTP